MSRPSFLSSALSSASLATPRRALPGVALSCLVAALATGCLDSDTTHEAAGGDDPLTLVAVAEPAAQALPPKPALAQLATATSATRQRFMDAALGTDVSDVFATVYDLGFSPPSCPSVDRRGSVLYSTPDCTDAAGVHWSGRLVAHAWDDDRPMVITLERWSADAPGTKDDIAYEGTVTVHPDGHIETNLVVATHGLVSRTFATWRTDDGKVIADVDSWVIVQEHGIAQIGGAWRLPRDGRPTGALYLDGADELMLDFDNADPACAPIVVDGEVLSKRCDLADLAQHMIAFDLF